MEQLEKDGTEDARIASRFLGWKPPLSHADAVDICARVSSDQGILRDRETDRLTGMWLSGETRRTLPEFKTSAKGMFRLLKHFKSLGFFHEIEASGNEFIATIFAESDLERIICSGRGYTRPEAVYRAAIDYMDSYCVWQAELANRKRAK